ncbi:MAG: hypothetical protein KatS3mg077_0583 [Candidatus Binatia bacterium]|nr:MAG: hypothetical protein KatS3mg077_0583 [Candidatus Binatia bacterium]
MKSFCFLGSMVVVGWILSGCGARVPENLRAGDIEPLTVAQAQRGEGIGTRVRWGGTIAHAHVGAEETCLEVVARPLDDSARPRRGDQSQGRFLACRPELLDPEIYARGRSVTVLGRVREVREGTIGDRPYRFPVIAADSIVLWQEPEGRAAHAPVVYYHPWPWGPPYWPPFWYYRPHAF